MDITAAWSSGLLWCFPLHKPGSLEEVTLSHSRIITRTEVECIYVYLTHTVKRCIHCIQCFKHNCIEDRSSEWNNMWSFPLVRYFSVQDPQIWSLFTGGYWPIITVNAFPNMNMSHSCIHPARGSLCTWSLGLELYALQMYWDMVLLKLFSFSIFMPKLYPQNSNSICQIHPDNWGFWSFSRYVRNRAFTCPWYLILF